MVSLSLPGEDIYMSIIYLDIPVVNNICRILLPVFYFYII